MRVLLMYEPDEAHRERLRRRATGAELIVAHSLEEAIAEIPTAEAVLGNRWFLQSLPHASRLQWMQSNSMGVDLVLEGLGQRPWFTLTSARGVYDDEIADHALALALALLRGLHLARDDQHTRTWNRPHLTTLGARHAMVLGWGGVGRGIAARLKAFGTEVRGVARRRRDPNPERLLDASNWRDELGTTDLLFVTLPLTGETRRLVGPREIAKLKAGSILVNVGRGETVDEAALLSALQNGHLAGAGLDVFEHEPLPRESGLWDEGRLLITPHVARSAEATPKRWQVLFEENLGRFVQGRPLLNVVDPDLGY